MSAPVMRNILGPQKRGRPTQIEAAKRRSIEEAMVKKMQESAESAGFPGMAVPNPEDKTYILRIPGKRGRPRKFPMYSGGTSSGSGSGNVVSRDHGSHVNAGVTITSVSPGKRRPGRPKKVKVEGPTLNTATLPDGVQPLEIIDDPFKNVDTESQINQEIGAAIESVYESGPAFPGRSPGRPPKNPQNPAIEGEPTSTMLGKPNIPKRVKEKPQESVCVECGKVYKYRKGLKRHMREVHGPPGSRLKCEICALEMSNIWALKRHMITHHKSIAYVEPAAPERLNDSLETVGFHGPDSDISESEERPMIEYTNDEDLTPMLPPEDYSPDQNTGKFVDVADTIHSLLDQLNGNGTGEGVKDMDEGADKSQTDGAGVGTGRDGNSTKADDGQTIDGYSVTINESDADENEAEPVVTLNEGQMEQNAVAAVGGAVWPGGTAREAISLVDTTLEENGNEVAL